MRSHLHPTVDPRRARWVPIAVLIATTSIPLATRAAPPVVEGFAPVPGLDDEEDDGPGLKTCAPSAPAATSAAPDALDLSPLRAEPLHGIPSSGFGWRDDPIRHRRRFHYGGDFRAPRDTPVYAAAAGTVVFAGRRSGYGRVIDVVHQGGLMTRYAHLNAVLVDKGASVEADGCIGRVGSTGRATGPHLHFEVRIEGRAVDPTEAMRVGELQRIGDPEIARQAALTLRASAGTAVSALDPPRQRARASDKAPARDRGRRRRHVS